MEKSMREGAAMSRPGTRGIKLPIMPRSKRRHPMPIMITRLVVVIFSRTSETARLKENWATAK